MDNWQRIFAYGTGSVALGFLLIILTFAYIPYVAMEGIVGYLVLLAYGFVFLNLGFGLARRYSLKTRWPRPENYIFSTLLASPTLLWVFTQGEELEQVISILFVATILFGVYLGTWYGIRRGLAKRMKIIQKVKEEEGISVEGDHSANNSS